MTISASKQYQLRDFQPDDFETIWKLDQICFTRGIAYSKRELSHFIRKPRAFTLVAEENKQICGFVVVERDGRQAGRIITIDVHPLSRGSGLGSLLMGWVEARLLKSGAGKIVLEVAVDNASAIKFYKGHGYSVVGTIPRYYLDSLDALRMEKVLVGGEHSATS